MTKQEIAVLGHAFFDGKVLQMWFKGNWKDWPYRHCPKFTGGEKWRIKPSDVKTITICTFVHKDGDVACVVKDSFVWGSYLDINNKQWTHIKSLDQVVEVE